MKKEHILPTLMIIIQLISAIPYIRLNELNMAVYWIAAAVLNIAVTYKF